MPRDSLLELLEEVASAGVQRLALNGCWQGDWGMVLELAHAHPGRLVPNVGLHPWWVHRRSPDWLQQLRALLLDNPSCGLGEVRWGLCCCTPSSSFTAWPLAAAPPPALVTSD